MKKSVLGIVLFCFAVFAVSCQNNTKTVQESYTSGSTTMIADESFEPIVDAQLYVFESIYPQAKINMLYKPEQELLNLFLNDSVRVAILSRKLNKQEEKVFTNLHIKIRVNRFAIDAISLVTHKSSPDSGVLVKDIKDLMQGKPSRIKSLVFDNPNSSTVRYLMELSGIKLLPKKGVYALKSNPEVIKYVHNNPGTIGVIGFNWIEQPDEDLEQYVADLKVLGVKDTERKEENDKFFKPNQDNLALGLYPLTRDLYIINCQGRPGLGWGFASFLASERGQRIVLKSGLLPDSIPSREIIIKK
ncbi:PstS family phosphate ABC transporter substrate-binding protein [Rubrolithibacter danxiaensis]|uniref:PstS family phosphate ABC transporter substrate-binding protein n=1 Tax=Rubrolithibacter danxiaensis TaxID=3390805 RepID=UPI003BF9257B